MFRAFLARYFLISSLTVVSVLLSSATFAQTPPAGTGKVKLEWLGHQFHPLTSPQRAVGITRPLVKNPDGPVSVEEVSRTDFILVPNSHNDDMGNPLEIAAASGAMVITPGPLGRWLIGNGLKQEQFRRAGIGDQFMLKGIKFKIGP